MCIGRNEPGGSKRCEGHTLTACINAQHDLVKTAGDVSALTDQRDALDDDLEVIEAMQLALAGRLSAEREAELLQRAEQYRIAELRRQLVDPEESTRPPEADTRADWERRIADIDSYAAHDRDEWDKASKAHADALADGVETVHDPDELRERLRAEYSTLCAESGEEATEEGLARYAYAETAADAAHYEHAADTLEGYYLRQWRQESVECHRGLAGHMDLDEAIATAEERAKADEFSQLVDTRDQARAELEAATEQWNQAKAARDENAAQQPFAYCTDPTLNGAVDAARDRLNAANSEYLVAKDDLDYYKDCTAQYAGRAGDLYAQTLPQYDEDTLGMCTRVGEFEQSSREWLEVRQNGFGGSDAAKALGYNKYDRPSSVVEDKVRAITDEEVAEQLNGINHYTGDAPRGHAWEQVMAKRFAEENPNLQLQHTKATWRGRESWQQVHLDDVIVDPAGNVVGPWEAKTASDRSKWDNGIPVDYRVQLAHQMDAMGAGRAALTVTIDDRETRTYWMGRDEPLDPDDPQKRTYSDRKHELRDLWGRVEKRRQDGPGVPKRNNSKFKWVANPGSQSSRDDNARTARQLAVYRGCSIDEATSMIQQRVTAGDKADAAVRHCYRNYHPRTDPARRFVVLDFETNGTHAGKHEVIQTGYQVVDGRGTVHEEANSYHGINPRSMSTVGVGMQDVHGISHHDVVGRRQFNQSEQKQRLHELANDPNVTFVAHSANFERSFLQANGIPTSRFIDTMDLSGKFDHQSTGKKLSDFTAARGIPYEDAHDAYNDARMTSRALLRFWDQQHQETAAVR